METFSLFLNTVYLHATEKKAISISLVMWSQVVIVKYTNPEHSRINTDTEEEDGKKELEVPEMYWGKCLWRITVEEQE